MNCDRMSSGAQAPEIHPRNPNRPLHHRGGNDGGDEGNDDGHVRRRHSGRDRDRDRDHDHDHSHHCDAEPELCCHSGILHFRHNECRLVNSLRVGWEGR